MSIKGKKIASFLAFPHHTRFFMPIREEIRKHKGDILFVTPLSDYPYELDMMKRNLWYRHFTDYMTDDVVNKINAGLSDLFERWSAICFKWKGFRRWPLFKETWIFKELIEEYFCMEKFMEVERPDLFLVHHECGRWGKIIGHLCYKNKIPLVTFQEGDYYTPLIVNSMHTEYSTANLLWGNMTKDRLSAYANSVDKMFPVGNTHIDGAIKEYSSSEVRTAIRKELAIPPDKKVVLFLVGVKYGCIKERKVWEGLLHGLERIDNSAVLIFKWHTNVVKAAIEQIKEIFREINPAVIILDAYDPYKLIAISDYCVALGQTTLNIEALAFGKPLFSIPDPDSTDDYLVNKGVAQPAYPLGNWASLFNTMESGVSSDMQALLGKFLADNFYKLDGKSVERVIGVISYTLDVRGSREKDTAALQKEFSAGKVSFIVPSGHDSEALMATLASLPQNVKYPDWEVVIVLSDIGVKETLSAITGGVSIISAEGNLAHLYNTGAKISSGEYLVFIRPGIVYFKDEGMGNAMKDGIAGVPIKNPDLTPYCLGIGFDFNFSPFFIKEEVASNAELSMQNAYRDAVGGGLIGMHRSIFESVRGFDDGIANHLIEPDICLKAKELNFPVRYLPDCLAFNYKETFFGEDISDESWKNRVRFFAKWVGVLPKDDDFLRHAGDMMKV
jgi:GT2 family glycosyltransferase